MLIYYVILWAGVKRMMSTQNYAASNSLICGKIRKCMLGNYTGKQQYLNCINV
jgi:hypothetical protein